jgi:hypothetical protein
MLVTDSSFSQPTKPPMIDHHRFFGPHQISLPKAVLSTPSRRTHTGGYISTQGECLWLHMKLSSFRVRLYHYPHNPFQQDWVYGICRKTGKGLEDTCLRGQGYPVL